MSFLFHTWGGGPRVVVSTAAFHARVRGSVPGLGGLKETKMFLPHPRVKVSIVGSLRDREVACSASDRQGSNFESCVWRTVSSQSSHHPQEVLLAQFSLCVHKGGLKPDSFHFIHDLWIIHNSYFISGCGAGNKMIDLLCSHIGFVQVVINYLLFYRKIQCFTMAMSFTMILILYVIPCKFSCDFDKLTILHIHVHIFYHFHDK